VAVVSVSSSRSVTEGNAGTTVLDVNVELQISSVPLARDVVVTVSTAGGTATGRLAQWGRGIVVVTEEMTGIYVWYTYSCLTRTQQQ